MTQSRPAPYVSASFVRLFGAALLAAAGCGGSSLPGGTQGKGGSGGMNATGSAGTSASGAAGTSASGAAGTSGGGNPGSAGSTSGLAGTGGGTATGTGGTGGGKIPIGQTQCSDGKDNDGDGLIDYFDPECISPADNDERSFATGIPGDNIDACKQDCFFDGNSGMGDDGCLWQLQCDPQSVEPKCPYSMQYANQHTDTCSVSASQSQRCIDTCRKWVPNGCDCFGCCVVPGASTPIRLAATCTAADFGNPMKCPPCTQVTQCSNPCERCEVCLGKPTVPADCTATPDAGTDSGTDSGTPGGCEGYTPCGPGTANPDPLSCPANTFCLTGCCVPSDPG